MGSRTNEDGQLVVKTTYDGTDIFYVMRDQLAFAEAKLAQQENELEQRDKTLDGLLGEIKALSKENEDLKDELLSAEEEIEELKIELYDISRQDYEAGL